MLQVWELFGQFLANETFASEMNINLSSVNESAIEHLPSDPHIWDNFEKPVRLPLKIIYFKVPRCRARSKAFHWE